jgi:ATP phosphoribosyltransferase
MIQEKTILRIAVQKSGRLYEDSVQLLKECGIDLRNVKDRLKTVSENFPLEVFFLRDDDIPDWYSGTTCACGKRPSGGYN